MGHPVLILTLKSKCLRRDGRGRVSLYRFPPFQMSCYQVRLAEDQELEEEEGDDSKDEGKTILKNKLPSCAE